MLAQTLMLAAASPENAAVEGVTPGYLLALVFMGVVITVLWLVFRKLKQLGDEPEKKPDDALKKKDP